MILSCISTAHRTRGTRAGMYLWGHRGLMEWNRDYLEGNGERPGIADDSFHLFESLDTLVTVATGYVKKK